MIPLSKPVIEKEEIKEVIKVLKSGWLTHGDKNKEFEHSVEEYIGVKRAVVVNSCASALFLTLHAAGITGEVLVPSFTFVASVNAIAACGAKPVFVDVEEKTYNMNTEIVESYITSRTEAIMPVHYAGHPCDMKRFMEIADKYKLFVVEDSAECLGGECFGKKAGSFGAGCFSFFPTKNITTCEGGMVTTNDDALADKIKAIAGHGISTTTHERQEKLQTWYREAIYTGYNLRMSQVHAALGVEQMKKIDVLNEKRRGIAKSYNKKLKRIKDVKVPVELEGYKHVYQMYVVRVPSQKRDEIVEKLNLKGVGASVHFEPPVHKQKAHSHLAPMDGLPVTEKICKEVITLPMYPSMKKKDVNAVCSALIECF